MRRLALAVGLLGLSSMAWAESPWGGTWILREPPQGVHLTMIVEEVGTGWKLTYKIVDPKAPGTISSTILTQLDGKDVPSMVDGKPTGQTMGIRKVDSRHAVGIMKFRGREMATSKSELSPDGKVLTVETEYAASNPTGQVGKEIQHWDRQ